MIVTNNEELAKLTKHLTTQAKPNPTSYEHDMIGYNYRLVNVLAAIGVAQMEQLDGFIERKQEIINIYRRELAGVGDIDFQKIPEGVKSNGWLFTISTADQAALLGKLNARKMISRAFWVPMNQLPMFSDLIYYNETDQCNKVFGTCLSIPSSTDITDADVLAVCNVIKEHYN